MLFNEKCIIITSEYTRISKPLISVLTNVYKLNTGIFTLVEFCNRK